MFSYAVTFLGRISYALRDAMSQNSLLDYLTLCSRSTGFSAIQFREDQPCLYSSKGNLPHNSTDETIGSFAMTLQEKRDGNADIQSSIREGQARSFREELETFTPELLAPAGVLSFTLQYLKTIKMLVKVWGHFLPPKYLSCRMGTLDLLLEKLDRRLRDLRTRFIGLSKEEELHVLELILITCTLKLSKVEICCKLGTVRKLCSTMSQVESLLKEGSIEPSKFVIEVGNLSSEICSSLDGDSSDPFCIEGCWISSPSNNLCSVEESGTSRQSYMFLDVQFVKRRWGPKHELTYLCQEKEVYFSTNENSQVGERGHTHSPSATLFKEALLLSRHHCKKKQGAVVLREFYPLSALEVTSN
ncbi:hypothetical protein FNV43_RR09608 [Rhamnella rubrinervis]|uniref:Uncharacterized protein n=1 Tax=Rhamnella rubrinervis TaxID=2594499 RepID=A0A8K0HAA4_9ROSA|nr:hypothetical protein FNV43_RR09608 [Rhamnella rubrinervis]